MNSQPINMRFSFLIALICLALGNATADAQMDYQTDSTNPMRHPNASIAGGSMERAIARQISPAGQAEPREREISERVHSSSSRSSSDHVAKMDSRPLAFQSREFGQVERDAEQYVTHQAKYVPQANDEVSGARGSGASYADGPESHLANSQVGRLQRGGRESLVEPATFQQSQTASVSRQTMNQNRAERDWLQHVNQLSGPMMGNGQPVSQAVNETGGGGASFIEREKSAEQSKPNASLVPTTRIAVNLAIVLAAAIAVLLVVRQWQQGKNGKKAFGVPGNLNVVQVLPLAGGASLYVVDGYQKRVLLAIDATGIKSVDVLEASFEETMNQMEAVASTGATQATFQAMADAASQKPTIGSSAGQKSFASDLGTVTPERRTLRAQRNRAASARTKDPRAEPEEITPTPDIDQQLIEMLLRNGSQAA